MNALQKYQLCFIAGLYAAGGSFFGKLPSVLKGCFLHATDAVTLNPALENYSAIIEFILCQCLPIALMIGCNLLNWRYFLKALQMTEQTLIATVLTSASNYVVTFILGVTVFGETFSSLSLIGGTFIVLGLWFLSAEKQSDPQKLKKT